MSIKVNLISLGCAKNLVDSEQMLAKMAEAGMEICPNIEDADVAVINTCGFIESAKKEAIDNILDLSEYKSNGTIKGIVVTGCLTERYKDDFFEQLPEVDAILGTGSYDMIVDAVSKAVNNEKTSYFGNIENTILDLSRMVSTPKYTAYIKISEGCNNRCAFCIIPSLRGKYRSRSIENIVEEAKDLAKNGTKELIIIAQDVTRYGKDIYKEYKLIELLKELEKIDGIKWIRLHYLYPELVNDELIDTIVNSDKILNYFDMPMQHINDRILKLMRRRGDSQYLSNLIARIRAKAPEAAIRTSLIVGLPTETEAEFEEFCEFLTREQMQRAGVFAFSREEGTEAYDMDGQVDEEVKQERRLIAEEIQSRVIDAYNDSCVGKTFEVLVEGFDEQYGMYFGRTYADSPDIDGIMYFDTQNEVKNGDFVNVEVTETFDPYLKGVEV
ncbi:MAG: 30S ribosomal protein S12 methylthiotransferase RimO [Clostridia bacterium]